LLCLGDAGAVAKSGIAPILASPSFRPAASLLVSARARRSSSVAPPRSAPA